MSSSPTETLYSRSGRRCPRWASRSPRARSSSGHKRPGDWVERDETVCLVTTDKIDVEIPSPASGRLERILIEHGDTVDVGTPLAELDDGRPPGRGSPRGAPRRTRPPAERGRASECETDRSGFHSPVVRRMAEEHGIDLSQRPGHRDRRAHPQAGPRRTDRFRAPGGVPSGIHAATERPLHIESPYEAGARSGDGGERRRGPRRGGDAGRTARAACRRCAGRSRHTWWRAGTRRPIARPIVEVDLSRVVAARRGAQAGDGAARRFSDLPRLRGERCGGRARPAPDPERIHRRRGDRLPRRCQSRASRWPWIRD